MHPTVDGPAHARIDALGDRVLVLPTRCRNGLHNLPASGYQIQVDAEHVHILCRICAHDNETTACWTLLAPRAPCARAEFDAVAYLPPPRSARP